MNKVLKKGDADIRTDLWQGRSEPSGKRSSTSVISRFSRIDIRLALAVAMWDCSPALKKRKLI
jgi:hypothetical protein